jgi:hypothetical protein
MAADTHRLAAMIAFTDRGWSSTTAARMALAIHPLDDHPAPGRAFEKAVRARAKAVARLAKRATEAEAGEAASAALRDYAAMATEMAEPAYLNRFDAALSDDGPNLDAPALPDRDAASSAFVEALFRDVAVTFDRLQGGDWVVHYDEQRFGAWLDDQGATLRLYQSLGELDGPAEDNAVIYERLLAANFAGWGACFASHVVDDERRFCVVSRLYVENLTARELEWALAGISTLVAALSQ